MKHNISVPTLDHIKIGVIGLGYVGLPLAVAFGRFRSVVGFDINKQRVDQLKVGVDDTLEVTSEELASAQHLSLTTDLNDLQDCTCFIITVQTPINNERLPDLTPLLRASADVGSLLKVGDIVIYESTVFPGCTEEQCVPVLELHSSLKYNKDFFCGYSPERISPGSSQHKLTNVVKVTSGSTPYIATVVDKLYQQIVRAGTYMAESIKIAEAAKVIENTQRDLNIALANEFAIIFNKLNIDTDAVIRAASTKWNFQSFRPGLVGGHCIGVDPYYLTYKAIAAGYHPKVILAGRELNDGMGEYVADKVIDAMIAKHTNIVGAKVLVMGFTFKENCPDIRNTKVVDIINRLKTAKCEIDVIDPIASSKEVLQTYGIQLSPSPYLNYYDAIVVAVAHKQFAEQGLEHIKRFGKKNAVVYDVKSIFAASIDKL